MNARNLPVELDHIIPASERASSIVASHEDIFPLDMPNHVEETDNMLAELFNVEPSKPLAAIRQRRLALLESQRPLQAEPASLAWDQQNEPIELEGIEPINSEPKNNWMENFSQRQSALMTFDQSLNLPPNIPTFGPDWNGRFTDSQIDLADGNFATLLAQQLLQNVGSQGSPNQMVEERADPMLSGQEGSIFTNNSVTLNPVELSGPPINGLLQEPLEAVGSHIYHNQMLEGHPGLASNAQLQTNNIQPSTSGGHTPANQENDGHPTLTKPITTRFIGNEDLITMSNRVTWTEEEIECGRRIISLAARYDRDVAEFTVEAHAISQEQYQEDMNTISCIYWRPAPTPVVPQVMGECVYTSVDVIRSIEKMVLTPDQVYQNGEKWGFNIAKKNRIRRHIENLGSYTVRADTNPDWKGMLTATFHHQLMNYTEPNVKNIAKEVKVFAWSSIGEAFERLLLKHGETPQNELCWLKQ